MIVYRRPPIAICTAVIWLSVSVPVLSELMADVEPSVSTERRRLTMAPALARVAVPVGRIVVTTAGRPVGIAETANATAVRKSVIERLAAARPSPIEVGERDAGDHEDLVRQRVELLGERRPSVVVAVSMPEMWPTSVPMPVVGDDERAARRG